MTREEFAKGWILLIAQPWGRRYEGNTEIAQAQREFYFNAVKSQSRAAWFETCCALASKNEWPSLGDLNNLMNPSGHPGPEEAWAIVAPKVRSDDPTIFVTDPMREAYGAALEAAGDRLDMVAARMAFREVYTNAVGRAGNGSVAWSIIPGTNRAMKELAITAAVKKGIAGIDWAMKQLPHEAHQSLLQFAGDVSMKRIA